ncbi:hypothetical protein [Chryseobacterium sp. Leaf394]|uniref:hypothetical protein n=1 Tax=Chryseobacterium sp. Leaf394 TaxID=1736361 RepID=UPI0006FAAEB9|nr:hypothetical protein [Chryseobacterium sp. Leaf394]KQS91625.1 hypothetical protein ASG21_03925 [Chryseobacterium sp. Leaf394]
MKSGGANYKAIYTDMIQEKFPEKMVLVKNLLDREKVSILDAIKINEILFPNKSADEERLTQKHKSYYEDDILKILEYQRVNKLNNIQIATKFKMSRNTIAKWKKQFNDVKDQQDSEDD